MDRTPRSTLPTTPPLGTVALTADEAMAHLGIRARALRNHVARGTVIRIIDGATGERRYYVSEAALAARGVHADAIAAAPEVTLRTTEAIIARAVERAVAGALGPLVAGLEEYGGVTSRLTAAYAAHTAKSEQSVRSISELARGILDKQDKALEELTTVRKDARTLARQVQALEQRWGDPAAVRARLAELAPEARPTGPLARLFGGEHGA